MNYRGRGRVTITFMDGTQQVLDDAELKVEPKPAPSPSPRGEAFEFSVPLSVRASQVLINWPALTQFQKLRVEYVRARMLGVPDEVLERFVSEEFERARATCENVDLAESVGARTAAFIDEERRGSIRTSLRALGSWGTLKGTIDAMKEAFDSLNRTLRPSVCAPPPSGPTKRKPASWKTRHYGPQRR